MIEYKKPHLKLGEALTLLGGEDYETIEILNSEGKIEFQGDLGEIRHAPNVDHYDQLRERYVKEINFNDFWTVSMLLEE